jgi:putative aldouronate transport system permease protein
MQYTRRQSLTRARNHWQIYLMMIPGLLLVLVFAYLPMFGLVMCFNDFNPALGIRGFWESNWVGFKWFVKFINSFYFERVVGNTLLINLAKLVTGFWVPIAFALLLNEEKSRFIKKSVQTVSYMPYFISWVVTIAMLESLFSPTTGLINNIRTSMGVQSIYYMGREEYFYPLILGSSIWKGFGWSSIIYLAAISGIGTEMYEAAIIDGCSRFKQAWYITLPSIRSLIVMMLLLNIGGLLTSDFQQMFCYIGNNSSLYAIGDVIDTYVYRVGLTEFQLSFGSAVGMFRGVIALILLLGCNWLVKRMGEEGLF